MSLFKASQFGVEPTNGKPRRIPNPSWVHITAFPEARTVYEGNVTSGEVAVDLHPGKYAICVLGRFLGRRSRRQVRCHYVIEFYHDCTAEQWEELQDLTPRNSECIITREGTVFYCRFCRNKSKTRIEAAMHECIHYGIDPLSKGADDKMQDVVPAVPRGFVPAPAPSINPLVDEGQTSSPIPDPTNLLSLEELP